MDIILCIETGTSVCSVALSAKGELIALRETAQKGDHATNLGVYIDEILREHSLQPYQLSAVAISKGPGSYTGLRIGTSLAKGLCYSLDIPLIAINSLESLAQVAMQDINAGIIDVEDISSSLLCPMIDARRMEVYTQIFNTQIEPLSDVSAEIITPESFSEFIARGNFLIFGDGAEKCVGTLSSNKVKYIDVSSSARGQIAIARRAFDEGLFEDTAYFEPFYLKDFVAKKSDKDLIPR